MMYKIGPLIFNLSGEGKLLNSIEEEFHSIRLSNNNYKPELTFNFLDTLELVEYNSTIDELYVGENVFKATLFGLTYQVFFENGLPFKINILNPDYSQNNFKRTIRRILNWNYLYQWEKHATIFIYGVFDYITCLHLLKSGSCYLHASAIVNDANEGICMVAWGGVGKSSSMLKYVMEHNYKYLSDDLVVLDKEGLLWRSPKKMQIYAYNLKNFLKLQKQLFIKRNILDKLSWNLHLKLRGPKKVRRRVKAEELFAKELIAEKAILKKTLFLQRSCSSDFSLRELTTTELAEKAANILRKELQPLFDYNVALSVIDHQVFLNSKDFINMAIKNISQGVKNSIIIQINIPEKATPKELISYLNKNILANE